MGVGRWLQSDTGFQRPRATTPDISGAAKSLAAAKARFQGYLTGGKLMILPIQSPPVIRNRTNVKHVQGVTAQECYCLGPEGSETWHCHFGRDFVNTGLECTPPPRQVAKKYKEGGCEEDTTTGKITCETTGAGGLTMEGDTLVPIHWDASPKPPQ
jgi:hypothetical protein